MDDYEMWKNMLRIPWMKHLAKRGILNEKQEENGDSYLELK